VFNRFFGFLLWCIQLILIFIVPQVADETYYWYWSQNLSLNYLDHPPVIAWVYALGGRWFNALMWPLSAYWVSQGLRQLEGGSFNGLFWILMISSPLGLVGSVIVTIDTPMIWAWCFCFYAWCRGDLWRLSLGLVIGIHSKLLFWLAVPGFIYHWRWRERGMIMGMILSVISLLSWIDSSASNGSFSFQLSHRLQMIHTSPIMAIQAEIEWILGQFFLISPLYLIVFYKSLSTHINPNVLNISNMHQSQKQAYLGQMLWLLALPCLFFCIVMNCFIRVEANWSVLFCLPLLVYLTTQVDLLKPPFFSVASHKLWYFQLISLAIVIGFALSLDVLPLSVGPVRSPQRLVDCIQNIRDQTHIQNIAFSRYQELSLVLYAMDHQKTADLSIHDLSYLRPENRRLSVFDTDRFWIKQKQKHNEVQPFILIAKPEWLKEIKMCRTPKFAGKCTLDLWICGQ
jgi:hypothetical protein